ncbi:hypothetical protein ACQ86G_11595 [Roseateles chitinivorans]|uniref:hypothetical protein n=1 Tax=Roseateles chitinivorans TaxID=2917965 RepID=UPI003D676D84
MSPGVFFLVFSVLLYLGSLALPAIHFAQGDVHSGFFLLCLGYLNGRVHWLANPLVWTAWLLLALRKPVPALIVLGAAVALMLGALQVREALWSWSWNSTTSIRLKVVALGTGYWVWLSSAIVAGIGALADWGGRVVARAGKSR